MLNLIFFLNGMQVIQIFSNIYIQYLKLLFGINFLKKKNKFTVQIFGSDKEDTVCEVNFHAGDSQPGFLKQLLQLYTLLPKDSWFIESSITLKTTQRGAKAHTCFTLL